MEKWEIMCKRKYKVGMGFRDMDIFNFALFAKQRLRLLKRSNSLVPRTLKARYYPTTSFLDAEKGYNPLLFGAHYRRTVFAI